VLQKHRLKTDSTMGKGPTVLKAAQGGDVELLKQVLRSCHSGPYVDLGTRRAPCWAGRRDRAAALLQLCCSNLFSA